VRAGAPDVKNGPSPSWATGRCHAKMLLGQPRFTRHIACLITREGTRAVQIQNLLKQVPEDQVVVEHN
jgi:hypothetical protein